VVFIYLLLDQNTHQDRLYARLDNGVTSGLMPESFLGSSIDKQMIGKRHKRLEFLKGELKLSDPEPSGLIYVAACKCPCKIDIEKKS
jgi:hypothetical protein